MFTLGKMRLVGESKVDYKKHLLESVLVKAMETLVRLENKIEINGNS